MSKRAGGSVLMLLSLALFFFGGGVIPIMILGLLALTIVSAFARDGQSSEMPG